METLRPQSQRMLEAVGVSEDEEAVYRLLLDTPGAPLTEIARTLGASTKQIRSTLEALERLGLVSRMVGARGRFLPAPPSAAIEVLILTRQEQLERARLTALELDTTFHASRVTPARPLEVVEVVLGREAVNQRFGQLVKGVSERILVFEKPPYAEPPTGSNEPELQLLARGISNRVIYDTEALTIPGRMEHLSVVAEAGEESRTLPRLPMKLFVFDEQMAFIPLSLDEPGMEGALLVQPSPVLDGLITLFETLWERAVPIDFSAGRPAAEGSPHEAAALEDQMLTLLVAGLKDQAVARQLGVAPRTVLRRVSHLMQALGAQTRFQAGWLAAKRGGNTAPP